MSSTPPEATESDTESDTGTGTGTGTGTEKICPICRLPVNLGEIFVTHEGSRRGCGLYLHFRCFHDEFSDTGRSIVCGCGQRIDGEARPEAAAAAERPGVDDVGHYSWDVSSDDSSDGEDVRLLVYLGDTSDDGLEEQEEVELELDDSSDDALEVEVELDDSSDG
jgi:hypothetical protein